MQLVIEESVAETERCMKLAVFKMV